MWRSFLWRWHYAYLVVVKRLSISFFSHVLMSMVTPLFYYCYYYHYFNHFCYYYFHNSITELFQHECQFPAWNPEILQNCELFSQKSSIVDVWRELVILFCAFFLFVLDEISGHLPQRKIWLRASVLPLFLKIFFRIFRRF